MLLARQSMLLLSHHPPYINPTPSLPVDKASYLLNTPQLACRQGLLTGRDACVPFHRSQSKIENNWFTDFVKLIYTPVVRSYCTIGCCMHPLSIEYVLVPKQTKLIFLAKLGIPGQFGVKTSPALKKTSLYHTLGHLSLASLRDLSTILSTFHLILVHFESDRDHTRTVSYLHNTKASPHYSLYITYIQPATTCNGMQNVRYARKQHDGMNTWYTV